MYHVVQCYSAFFHSSKALRRNSAVPDRKCSYCTIACFFRYGFWAGRNTRSGYKVPTLQEAQSALRSMTGKAIWGNETSLTLLGEKYSVVWLLAKKISSESDACYFCPVDDGVVANEHTRYAMLYVDSCHYQAIMLRGEGGEEGSFLMADMPAVVRTCWNL